MAQNLPIKRQLQLFILFINYQFVSMQQSRLNPSISEIKRYSPTLFKRWCEGGSEALPTEFQSDMLKLLHFSEGYEDESLEIQIANLKEVDSRQEMLDYLTNWKCLYKGLQRLFFNVIYVEN